IAKQVLHILNGERVEAGIGVKGQRRGCQHHFVGRVAYRGGKNTRPIVQGVIAGGGGRCRIHGFVKEHNDLVRVPNGYSRQGDVGRHVKNRQRICGAVDKGTVGQGHLHVEGVPVVAGSQDWRGVSRTSDAGNVRAIFLPLVGEAVSAARACRKRIGYGKPVGGGGGGRKVGGNGKLEIFYAQVIVHVEAVCVGQGRV